MSRLPVDRSAAPALGPVPAFTFPRIERYVLPTGLKVRTVEHTSAPVLTMSVRDAARAHLRADRRVLLSVVPRGQTERALAGSEPVSVS